MAVIERASYNKVERIALFRSMDKGALIGQQMVQRGAIDALEYLLEAGITEEGARAMLDSLREGLMDLHEVANGRGVELVSYQAP